MVSLPVLFVSSESSLQYLLRINHDANIYINRRIRATSIYHRIFASSNKILQNCLRLKRQKRLELCSMLKPTTALTGICLLDLSVYSFFRIIPLISELNPFTKFLASSTVPTISAKWMGTAISGLIVFAASAASFEVIV